MGPPADLPGTRRLDDAPVTGGSSRIRPRLRAGGGEGDVATLGVLGTLRVGSRLIHTGRPTPGAYAAAGGSLYFGVPTVWARVCANPDSATALRSARLLVSRSAPLPVPVFDRLAELTVPAQRN